MAVNIIISAAEGCPAAAGGAREETNLKIRKIGVCLIVLGELSLGVLYGYFIKGVTKKQDGPVSSAFFEAFVGRFLCVWRTDIHPCHFQGGWIEGPGRG